MLSLHEQVAGRSRRQRWSILLLSLAAVLLVMPVIGASSAIAQDGGAAVDKAGTDDAAPADPVSKNFLAWMAESLGVFWLLVFAALSFVMVALIMMNILQVRRDVLLPNDFV